jgi:hypothetical protein
MPFERRAMEKGSWQLADFDEITSERVASD